MSISSIIFLFLRYLFNLLLALTALAVILILAFPIGFYGMALYIEPSLPSLSEIKEAKLEMPLQIYSNDEKLIAQYGNRISLPVSYEEIPNEMILAFLAAEDASFYEHSGISVKGLGRAITEVISSDSGQTGGSTITMQVAKNYFLTPERTVNRKLTELFLSRKIEAKLTKSEILTLYVNKIYLGQGAYGIQAAARKYYSKTLDHLTIAEFAMLAGLPKAPSKYNPVVNPERALERRNWILGRMQQLGYITDIQYKAAINTDIGLNLYRTTLDASMPYLAEMARYSLVNTYGNDIINSGWRVKLTVNSNTQKFATKTIQNHLIRYDRAHGWRGAESSTENESLANFRPAANMYPAEVVKVNNSSFDAILQSGELITVPWSGINWARPYINANSRGRTPVNASKVVAVGDIVRVKPEDKNPENFDKTTWKLTQIPKVQGSLVSINPDSGALVALVGGFDFNYSKFNRATNGWRQPGSTIKPLVYSAALEHGYRPDSMISDSPLTIGGWKPRNSDGRYYGDMTLRRGLYLSRNLVSIRLLRSIGSRNALNLLDQFGLDKDKLPTTLSLALGAGQASPLQMATAYSTFANGGHRIQPYFIDQIYSFDKKLIYQANPKQACAVCYNKHVVISDTLTSDDPNLAIAANTDTPLDYSINATSESDRMIAIRDNSVRAEQAPRILSSSVAYEMSSILRDVIQKGTATRARALGRSDIGGKTGTTNDFKDAWFAGFHPTNATVVWIGFDQPSSLGRGAYGGRVALPVWMDFMRYKLQNTSYQWTEISNEEEPSEKPSQQVIEITDSNNRQSTELDENDTDGANDDSELNNTEEQAQNTDITEESNKQSDNSSNSTQTEETKEETHQNNNPQPDDSVDAKNNKHDENNEEKPKRESLLADEHIQD